MKVAIFEALGKISIIEKPKPKIGNGEALVKVDSCGICGSDLHGYLDGTIIKVGTVMGHECSGTVDSVGANVEGFSPGERVVVKPYFQCEKCYWCQKGQPELCTNLVANFLGNSTVYDGAFAEFLKIPHPNKMLLKLPPNVSMEDAALIEPLATSFHCIRISQFKPGDNVVIIGAGPIGLGILQLLRIGGAGKVIVLQRSPERARLAEKMGADAVFNPEAEGDALAGKIYGLTGGIGADIVFEASGAVASFGNAFNLMRAGGEVVVVGIYAGDVPFNPTLAVMKGANMKGSVAYADYDFKRIIEFLERDAIDTELFISDIISLDDIEEKGFKRLLSDSKGIKILVKP